MITEGRQSLRDGKQPELPGLILHRNGEPEAHILLMGRPCAQRPHYEHLVGFHVACGGSPDQAGATGPGRKDAEVDRWYCTCDPRSWVGGQ